MGGDVPATPRLARAIFPLAVATFLILSSASLGASDVPGGPGGSGPRPTPAGSPGLARSSPTPSTPASATPGPATSEPFDDETVLVGFTPGTGATEIQGIAGAVGASHVDTIGAGTHVLRVPKGAVLTKIAALRANPHVRYAEPDYILHADFSPNDPEFNRLWGMKTILADQAWNSTTGTSGVVVGVVDTGLDYTHPDLAANIWSNATKVNGCPVGTHGYNVITATCDAMDDNRHGTHVSGTIGAVGNNGIGVIGVSPTTRLMGLKFLNTNGSGSTSGAVSAIDWAVRAKQAGVNVRVLSNSWGGGGFSQALLDEINKAGANDILFVVAAGNYASNNDGTPFYPCGYRAASEVCVAATDKSDKLASFSNYGASSVDLGSPGVNIFSTVLGGGYDYLSGTSMATPHVSGTAALVLATGYQSVSMLKASILAAVDPLASLTGLVRTGGRLDVCKAIPACRGVVPSPSPPTPSPGVGDFSLSSPDRRQAVSPGSSTTYTVIVTSSGAFAGQVALTVSGLPVDSTGAFVPAPVQLTSGTSTYSVLTVTASSAAVQGNYTLTITGTSGSLTHGTTVVLHIMRN